MSPRPASEPEDRYPGLYPSPYDLPPVRTEHREWVLTDRRTGTRFWPDRDRWVRVPDDVDPAQHQDDQMAERRARHRPTVQR